MDRDSIRAEIAEATAHVEAAGPQGTALAGGVMMVDLLSIESLTAKLAAQRRGERGPVYVVCIPKYAPAGTEGWVYTVDKVNKTTVSCTPVGGGRGLRAHPISLAEANADDLSGYAKIRELDSGVELHSGAVVRIEGPGWKQHIDALWVVTALKGMTDVTVARLGGEDNGRVWPKIPRSYIAAVIGPNGLADAISKDERFA